MFTDIMPTGRFQKRKVAPRQVRQASSTLRKHCLCNCEVDGDGRQGRGEKVDEGL